MGGAIEQSSVFHLQGDLVNPDVLEEREDLLRTRRPALALGVGLDLLLAAGLLRLSADQTWRQLATAATVVALRCLTTRGSRTGAAAWRGPRPATAGHHDHDLDR